MFPHRFDTLIILCGGMSKKVGPSSGGAGGTFVALNKRRDLLIAAGGGGGTRGYDAEDHDGRSANINSDAGTDGLGSQWGGWRRRWWSWERCNVCWALLGLGRSRV